ncbi:Glu/Leu/Phe/Val dehydrogenase dimerization domain-containing protein [Aquisalimonas sp.]|uniref:Glu/Leu/Phe/Val dehydrogenase dimerization domain-containing protein n=1 Tax=Aquisalimonas sp. TaxID=1872621 RepID=UPI0025C6C621|nr:Glu/Leu/Phe/Val dehydrogenase dimerization domain-containing protein [Aquisalimonas sp.]
MTVFTTRDFDDHEQVVFCCDPSVGLKAIIAIHNTNRGPSLGGCRMWPYPTEEEALQDVLRLSRGMTYKSAISNLPLGGGKSVIIGNPRADKNEALLRAMGRFIDTLNGRYIGAEDSGTSVEDIKVMNQETSYVAGILEKPTDEDQVRSGDPSPATAYGTFIGLRAAVKYRLGRDDLTGLKVAVQGMGNVGYRLAKLLHEAGAKLWVTDIYDDQVQRAVENLGANAVDRDAIYGQDVDVFAPCALGSAINDSTLAQLRAKVVAGSANNQLAEMRHGEELMKRGILYAPDYVINAGGIIDVSYERIGYDRDKMIKHVEGIYDTLMEIFERSEAAQLPTNIVADGVAEERFRK